MIKFKRNYHRGLQARLESFVQKNTFCQNLVPTSTRVHALIARGEISDAITNDALLKAVARWDEDEAMGRIMKRLHDS